MGDTISVKMIKPYAVSIARQLTLISQNSLAVGTFPLIGKKQILFRFIKRKQKTNCFKLQTQLSFTNRH